MGYAFDNASAQATAHHDALADLLDGPTRRTIEDLVDLPGARCLDVAAGAGSVALWLASRGASVVATDIAPQHIPARPGLTVLQHDIVADGPPGRFDLVHARLLLGHLPQRLTALATMVAALAPGGVLVTGEFAAGPRQFVEYAPDDATADTLSRYMAAHVAVFRANGFGLDWPHRAPSAFTAAGLIDVRSRVDDGAWHDGSWHGGDAGCRLLLAGIPQLRAGLLANGLTDDDLAATTAALQDPRVVLNGFQFFGITGRAPR